MVGGSFPSILSGSWRLTLADIPPTVIGFIIILTIIVVLVVVIVKWYQYWVKKGFEEYERQQRTGQ